MAYRLDGSFVSKQVFKEALDAGATQVNPTTALSVTPPKETPMSDSPSAELEAEFDRQKAAQDAAPKGRKAPDVSPLVIATRELTKAKARLLKAQAAAAKVASVEAELETAHAEYEAAQAAVTAAF